MGALRFRRRSSERTTRRLFAPPVSILKSLKGHGPHMYAAFAQPLRARLSRVRSAFRGARSRRSRRWRWSKSCSRNFPGRRCASFTARKSLGLNGKVSNLAQMLPQARYEHIIINDSDIVVPPRLSAARDVAVRRSARRHGDDALSRDCRERRWARSWRRLDSAPTLPGACCWRARWKAESASAWERPWRPPKTVLAKIGGLERAGGLLGRRLRTGRADRGLGLQGRAGGHGSGDALPDYSFRDFWLHQMRWARNVKDRRPGQYFGLIVTFGLAWAILAVLARPFSWWTWAVLAITAVARLLRRLWSDGEC